MKPRISLWLMAAIFLATVSNAHAQQPSKVPHIGYLVLNTLSSQVARMEAFRQGLRELGYVEGKNVVIDWRSADGKLERRRTGASQSWILSSRLVRLQPELPRKLLLRFPLS